MTIKKLVIRNFQKHKKLVLEFSNGITTITGDSESGKSAVLRAVRLIAFNQPSGKSYIRKGSIRTRLRITLDSGSSIGRIRGMGNTYTLDGRILKAIGKGKVPEEIAKALNLSEVNFQDQHDPLFWLTDSAGQVSRNLNKIINLEIIDSSLAKATQKINLAKAAVQVSEDRLTEARTEKRRLQWVVEYDERLRVLEELDRERQGIEEKASSLGSLLESIESLARRKEATNSAALAGGYALQLGERLQNLDERIGNLSDLLDNIAKTRRVARATVPDLTELENLKAEGDRVDEEVHELEYLLERIEEAKRIEKSCLNKLTEAERELKKESKGKCPVCGQSLHSSSRRTSTCATRPRSPEPVKLFG